MALNNGRYHICYCSYHFILGIQVKRQETIYLKSIAIILVIGEHVLGSFCGFENGHILNLMGTGAVCLFLVLSGYGTYVSLSLIHI